MENKELRKKSKQGGIISLVGFFIVILVFVFAAIKLNDLNDTIKLKTDELSSLDTIIENQNKNIELNKNQVKELVAEINKLKDPSIQPDASAVELPGIFDSKGRQVYDFTIWITSSQFTLNKISKVTYHFDQASYIIKNRESTNKSNGFLVSYRGWGCLSLVKATVEYENNETEVVYFDMCEKLSQ